MTLPPGPQQSKGPGSQKPPCYSPEPSLESCSQRNLGFPLLPQPTLAVQPLLARSKVTVSMLVGRSERRLLYQSTSCSVKRIFAFFYRFFLF